MLYLVTYQCNDSERRRSLCEVLRGLSDNVWNAFEHVWVIESDEPATALRDRIKKNLAADEAVIVALLAGHAAWHGFERDSLDWLLTHL